MKAVFLFLPARREGRFLGPRFSRMAQSGHSKRTRVCPLSDNSEQSLISARDDLSANDLSDQAAYTRRFTATSPVAPDDSTGRLAGGHCEFGGSNCAEKRTRSRRRSGRCRSQRGHRLKARAL